MSSTTEPINDCNDEHSPPTKKKKCALEKLLGDTFPSANHESSLSVSLNELVLVELSRYKSEPVLELHVNEKPLEWWKSHHQSYIPPSSQHGTEATSLPSERLFSTAGNIVNAK